jgi:hypothetical protein
VIYYMNRPQHAAERSFAVDECWTPTGGDGESAPGGTGSGGSGGGGGGGGRAWIKLGRGSTGRGSTSCG